MGPTRTFTITATMPDRWVPHFLGMLAFMEWAGDVGASRVVRFFADGDGDFHPHFKWDVKDVVTAQPTEGGSDEPFWDAG